MPGVRDARSELIKDPLGVGREMLGEVHILAMSVANLGQPSE